MKFWPLIWAGLRRKPGRAALTFLSIVNAFFLLGILRGFGASLGGAVAASHADTLVVTSRVSQIEPLPVWMAQRLEKIPGVAAVAPMIIFHGGFRSQGVNIRAYAVDPDALVRSNPDEVIPANQLEALRQTPDGIIVPKQIANVFGWRVGDHVPIRSVFWARKDGSSFWPLEVVGVFASNPRDIVFGPAVIANYRYVDEGRAGFAGTASLFLVKVTNPAMAGQVARRIDDAFANSPNETRTVNEQQLAQESVNQIEDVGMAVDAICGATLFALLVSVGSVLFQSARERTSEFAVMKVLGFKPRRLLLLVGAESLVFCVVAAAIGLGLAALILPLSRSVTGLEAHTGPVLATGLAAAVVLALLTGLPAALRAARLSAVDGLAAR